MMTLVVSLALTSHVIQVSDCRLSTTLLPGGQLQVVTDQAIKSTVFCGRAVVGYTGLAELEGERTDQWISREMSVAAAARNELPHCLEHLVERLNQIADKGGPVQRQGLQLVVVGFTSLPGEKDLTNVYATVTNALDSTGSPLDEYSTGFRLLAQTGMGLFQAPEWLDARSKAHLDAAVLGELAGEGRIEEVVGLLVETVRTAAAEHPAIGRNVMVTVIPRAAALQSVPSISSGPPNDDTATGNYLPNGEEYVGFLPNFVCGASHASGVRIEYQRSGLQGSEG